MPEDLLEWGVGEARSGWTTRFAVPPVAPYVLAGVGVAAYFVSVSRPWRLYTVGLAQGSQTAGTINFNDRPEYALSFGLGMTYTVAALALAAIFAMVLLGSQRMKRVATGVGVAIGVMCVAQLVSVVTVAGADSVYFDRSLGVNMTVVVESGLYAAFVAVVALVAATVSTHLVDTRRRRRAPADEPEYATDTPRDLTVSAS